MGLDGLSKKLSKATQATQHYISKKWEGRKDRHPNDEPNLDPEAQAAAEREREAAELARKRQERDEFLRPITAKLHETKESNEESEDKPTPAAPENDMEHPLAFSDDTSHRAVLLVTTPIEFGNFELSKQSYRLLARHVGMTMNSISHWALCVIDRGFGICYCYDLMSDRLEFNMLGRNVFRVNEITSEFIQTWSSCNYIGETTKTHEEIQEIGRKHMTIHPKYSLLESNCQHLAENLVMALCNGKVINQAKLSEELSLISPKIAMDMMMARLQNKLDDGHEKEDSDSVNQQMDVIKGLWGRLKKH